MLANPWGLHPIYRTTLRSAAVASVLLLAASACGSTTTTEALSGGPEGSSSTEPQMADSGVPSLGSVPTEDASTDSKAGDSEEVTLDENSTDAEIFAVWKTCMVDEGLSDLENMAIADLANAADLESDPAYAAASQVCDAEISDAFGSFELDPAMEAELRDRSVQLAQCGRDLLGIDIPDEVLFLEDDDPRMAELENLETTPEQDAAIEDCLQEALGDLVDEDGNLKVSTDDSTDAGTDQ